MRRRRFLPIPLCLALTRLARAQPATPEPEDAPQPAPHYKVSAAQLQSSVAQRFPMRFPVPGLMNLDVQMPQLRLLPAVNRLGAVMDVVAAGPALAQQTLLEVVVHTLRAQDLALPDALGMQPGSMTVTDEGLTIGFVPKR
jgi:hypothetical protein